MDFCFCRHYSSCGKYINKFIFTCMAVNIRLKNLLDRKRIWFFFGISPSVLATIDQDFDSDLISTIWMSHVDANMMNWLQLNRFFISFSCCKAFKIETGGGACKLQPTPSIATCANGGVDLISNWLRIFYNKCSYTKFRNKTVLSDFWT